MKDQFSVSAFVRGLYQRHHLIVGQNTYIDSVDGYHLITFIQPRNSQISRRIGGDTRYHHGEIQIQATLKTPHLPYNFFPTELLPYGTRTTEVRSNAYSGANLEPAIMCVRYEAEGPIVWHDPVSYIGALAILDDSGQKIWQQRHPNIYQTNHGTKSQKIIRKAFPEELHPRSALIRLSYG